MNYQVRDGCVIQVPVWQWLALLVVDFLLDHVHEWESVATVWCDIVHNARKVQP